MTTNYDDYVFVNCPFDNDYADKFDALVFTIYKCNFHPRCSKEADDAGENRLDKIVRIIEQCRFGIHDISRTEAGTTGLPRFNMPLELGIFLGARKLGAKKHRTKQCLVFDRKLYRYQEFISDLAGQDVKSHDGDVKTLVIAVRDWLSSYSSGIASGSMIWSEYSDFQEDLPALCDSAKLVKDELTFMDYIRLVYTWLENQEKADEEATEAV